jgi:hypothetical protein
MPVPVRNHDIISKKMSGYHLWGIVEPVTAQDGPHSIVNGGMAAGDGLEERCSGWLSGATRDEALRGAYRSPIAYQIPDGSSQLVQVPANSSDPGTGIASQAHYTNRDRICTPPSASPLSGCVFVGRSVRASMHHMPTGERET